MSKLGGLLCAVAAMLVGAAGAQAAVRSETFDYQQGGTVLQGFVAWDDAANGRRPGVLVYPQWTGPSDHEREAAMDLAKLGYVAMVADVYGKGVHPAAPKEAGAMSGTYLADRPLLRARVKAAYDRLASDPHVDAARIAAIGYCFGGASVLELGRQGADVKALVTLHGDLSNPTPADAKNIKGHVLVLHGADDPIVPPPEVDAFKAEMKAAGTDLVFVSYSGTRHGFTQPASGSDVTQGSAYNPVSARRAWVAMTDFLSQTFAP